MQGITVITIATGAVSARYLANKRKEEKMAQEMMAAETGTSV